MVWSKWKAALFVIAACAGAAGVAWSQNQTPSGTGPKLIPVKYMTIHEDGKAIKCQFLESLHTPDGQVIHRVRSVSSGEVYELEETQMVVREGTKPKHSPACTSSDCARPAVRVKAKPRGLLARIFGKSDSCCSGKPATETCTPCQQGTSIAIGDCEPCKPGIASECSPYSGSIANCPPCKETPGGQLKPVPKRSVADYRLKRLTPRPLVTAPATPKWSPYTPSGPETTHPTRTTVITKQQTQKAYPVVTLPCEPCTVDAQKEEPFPVVASKRPVQTRSTTHAPRKTLRESLQSIFQKRPAKTATAKNDTTPKKTKLFNTAIAEKDGPEKKHVLQNPKTPKKADKSVAKADTLPKVPFNPNWRKMWGQSPKSKTDAPGQSLVEKSKLPPVSVTADGKASDPLLDPNQAASEEVKKKFGIAEKPSAEPPAGATSPKATASYTPVGYPEGNPYGRQMPMGVQSALAAKSGMYGKMTYVPVPVVTMPKPARPPAPPYPKVPQPPQANKFVNAFTPPPSEKPKAQQAPQGNRQAMLPRYPSQVAGYSNLPYPPNPNMAPQPTNSRYPVANVNYPRQYPGPMPPQPRTKDWNTPRPVVAAQHRPAPQQLPNAPQQTMPAQQPHPMYQQPQPAQMHPMYQQQQLLNILQNSAYPSQREVAAQNLSRYDWRQNPHIVMAMLAAAKDDPSATVRAGCVHCLTKMNVDTPQFRQILTALQNDEDPRVRHEVGLAQTRMGVASPNGQPAVQPAGGTDK